MSRRRTLSHLLLAALVAAPACTLDVSSNGTGDGGGGGSVAAARSVELVQSDRPPPASKVSDVVERVLPSVVNVRVTALGEIGFGTERARGQGSGVVISSDGIIVTNAHVVRQALEVTVVVDTGEGEQELEGEVLGQAPERDLAVIRVEADDLQPITLGHSEGPNGARLGDSVVALGFPLGLGGATVTAGIVSGKNRTISVGEASEVNTLVDLLQTDAAINPGNSGGALVDMSGQLIGINTAAAQAGAAENIGFAIAIDDALPVIREILTEPREERAWLGVQVTPVTDALAIRLGLPLDTRGAVVAGIIPASPAEEVGIEQGDVIVAIDGEPITSATDLTDTLTRRGPGDVVELDIVSPRGARTETVELAQRPAAFER